MLHRSKFPAFTSSLSFWKGTCVPARGPATEPGLDSRPAKRWSPIERRRPAVAQGRIGSQQGERQTLAQAGPSSSPGPLRLSAAPAPQLPPERPTDGPTSFGRVNPEEEDPTTRAAQRKIISQLRCSLSNEDPIRRIRQRCFDQCSRVLQRFLLIRDSKTRQCFSRPHRKPRTTRSDLIRCHLERVKGGMSVFLQVVAKKGYRLRTQHEFLSKSTNVHRFCTTTRSRAQMSTFANNPSRCKAAPRVPDLLCLTAVRFLLVSSSHRLSPLSKVDGSVPPNALRCGIS